MSSPTAPAFALDMAVHDAALTLQAPHQEDFQRLVKVLTQIHGFRLYFVEIDSIEYRDQLIARLNQVLSLSSQAARAIDLSSHAQYPSFDEFETSLAAAPQGTVIHLLNGEVWLARHTPEFNIRRNAIAAHSQCASLWWLPRSAIQRIAKDAPDVWSWRHGVFSFAMAQPGVPALPPNLSADALHSGTVDRFSSSLPQKSKRLASLRQMLDQEMNDEMRWPLVMEMVDLLELTGHPAEALDLLRNQALPLAEKILPGDPAARANTINKITDILQVQGQEAEAIRIRREEVLPIFAQLGDVRSHAITQGQVANALLGIGELDQALRIHRDELLPVFRTLGDEHSYAVSMGKIAVILLNKGELDEALRIFREELLPTFETLGDAYSRATTMSNIAAVLELRGELDEALRIRREEVLPIYEKLGAVREIVRSKADLALNLALGGKPEDRPEIDTLLRQAHAMAQRFGVHEQDYISQLYADIFKKPL